MPPTTTPLNDLGDDDYVAQVLASEARDNSLKYSSQGLGAYMPKRPSSGAPKPNTRFLRNIIRDTDNHNASLKRKEEREARERMRQLRDNASASASTSSRDHRRHRDSDRDRRGDRRDRHRDSDRHRSHRRRHRSRSPDTEREKSRRHRRHESYESDEERRGSHRRSRRRDEHERRREKSYSRSRSRSPRYDRSRSERHRRSSPRSISPARQPRSAKSSSKDDSRRSRDHHSSKRNRQYESPPETALSRPSSPESDPLEDLVGPLPQKEAEVTQAIRSRGRGAYKPNSSNIDSHFAEDYDPTLDVHLDDDDSASRSTRRPVAGLMTGDDDWELALEALRDRARWKQKGEERLREAGFNDSIVERWKSNTTATGDGEGRLEDVKWSKRGEGREWDRGKVVDDEGRIDVRASWF